MASLRSLLKDTVFIVKSDGRRLGPYQAAVSSDSIAIMEKAIDVDEGDHVARPIPSGKEEIYLVLSAGQWFNHAAGWYTPGAGGAVHHPPAIVHAMRAGPAPLLAVWCLWLGP